ncbi:uncharacterized protein LOC143539281 [Bidens hawaiensis]|uniref:uncharacterized protein LOC143539281 n=1 Tax=Bidens hawaiensis TaxID=980011 RepID=UPI004049B94B
METHVRTHERRFPASTASNGESPSEKVVEKKIEDKKSPEVDLTRIPYPARLQRQKYAQEYENFLDMFKQLKINLPFVEALQHMPKYSKFLKDLLSNKKKLEGLSTLDHGEPVPTRMSLSLADRSVKNLRGKVENVLVKVDKFIFSVDFVILDMEADDQVPLILGRSFPRTAKALIDVFYCKITLRVGEENVTFDVIKSMRNSNFLNQEDEVDFPSEHDLSILVSSPPEYPEVFTVADSTEGPKERPSIVAPTSLELKEPPPHLEYAFLDGDADLPVIISSQLTDDEKSRLVDVLKEHK